MTIFLFQKNEIIITEVEFIKHQLIVIKELYFMEIQTYYFSQLINDDQVIGVSNIHIVYSLEMSHISEFDIQTTSHKVILDILVVVNINLLIIKYKE